MAAPSTRFIEVLLPTGDRAATAPAARALARASVPTGAISFVAVPFPAVARAFASPPTVAVTVAPAPPQPAEPPQTTSTARGGNYGRLTYAARLQDDPQLAWCSPPAAFSPGLRAMAAAPEVDLSFDETEDEELLLLVLA